jgi:hypothetical protein
MHSERSSRNPDSEFAACQNAEALLAGRIAGFKIRKTLLAED